VLTRYGIEPGRVSDPGFMVSGTERFDEDRIDITAVVLRSFITMENHLRQRHKVPAPYPGGQVSAVTGTKIYFVNIANSRVDIDPLVRVAREGLLT
jgi:hypothetical protein